MYRLAPDSRTCVLGRARVGGAPQRPDGGHAGDPDVAGLGEVVRGEGEVEGGLGGVEPRGVVAEDGQGPDKPLLDLAHSKYLLPGSVIISDIINPSKLLEAETFCCFPELFVQYLY